MYHVIEIMNVYKRSKKQNTTKKCMILTPDETSTWNETAEVEINVVRVMMPLCSE